MSDDANRLIDSLFERIKEAAKNSGARDKDAEALINKHLVQEPAAPYYMAQTILMQEAALKRLNARVGELEKAAAMNTSSGGFLSGLFGGNQDDSQSTNQRRTNQNTGRQNGYSQGYGQQQNYGQQPYGQQGGFGRGSSFLGGALQTAAGVAGGMVVGDMLMNMFSHHSQTEIVDVINEQPVDADMGQNGFADSSMNSSDYDQTGTNDTSFGDNDFGGSNFDDSRFDQNGFGNSDVYDSGFGSGDFDDFDNMGDFDT